MRQFARDWMGLMEAPDRLVLFHYHLFKNAGSSVDRVLERCFGDRWLTREFDDAVSAAERGAQVADWIADSPRGVAFSSHTAELPVPKVPGVLVFPIIFLRQPIDRVASVYAFESKQAEDTSLGSMIAKHTNMAGYVKIRGAITHDRQCRDFHVHRLAKMWPDHFGPEFERARLALQALPFIGIVEEFDRSMARLRLLLEHVFPDFSPVSVIENQSRDPSLGMDAKLEAIRRALGESAWQALEAMNSQDLRLYAEALRNSQDVRA
jgi:hypothetical protein